MARIWRGLRGPSEKEIENAAERLDNRFARGESKLFQQKLLESAHNLAVKHACLAVGVRGSEARQVILGMKQALARSLQLNAFGRHQNETRNDPKGLEAMRKVSDALGINRTLILTYYTKGSAAGH